MTISLNETVDLVRRNFRDVMWSEDTLKEWVKQAVKEYSKHFPDVASMSDTTVVGTYQYDFFEGTHDEEDLPVILEVVSVEYPADEDPPEFASRMDHKAAAFFSGDYYDVVIYPSRNNGEIWISDPDGSDFEVIYHTEHSWTSVDSGSDENTEVTAHHQPIIIQYVVYLCWREMVSMETMKLPDEKFASKLAAVQQRADTEYVRWMSMVESAKRSTSIESESIQWSMDKYDHIY